MIFADHNPLPLILHWFSDDELSIVDNFIIWMNVFGSAAACVYAGMAAKKALLKTDRVNMMRVSALAALYSVAFFVLLFDEIAQPEWASVMRGVSLAAWLFVWILPARAVWKQNELISKKVEEEIKTHMDENLSDGDL